MQFMVIERFRDHDALAIYRRLDERGRGLPEGATYVASWVAADLGRCFQIMEAESIAPLQRWVTTWSDLADFEIVPVATGAETHAALKDLL